MMHQHVGLLPRNPGYCRQQLDRFGHLPFDPFGHHDFGLDVHLPARQLRREPRILAPLANRQRELVRADRDPDSLPRFINLEGLQFRRGQRVGNEIPDVRVPADDVHLLVIQFPHDVLDPLPPQPDASAHWVHLLVAGPDRQLGPEPRFAGDAFDLNSAIVDFGYFQLKQLDHETRVGAGQDDFRAVGAVFHRLDKATNPLAYLVFLGWHTLAVGQQGLIFAQIHQHVRPVKAPDRSVDDVAHPVLKFSEDKTLFLAPDMLHQGLLGILGGDTAKANGGHFNLDLFAKLSFRTDAPGIEHGYLIMLGYDLFRHDQFGKGANVAVLLVDNHSQLARRANCLLGGGQERLLYSTGQDITVDALFAFPKFQDC